MRGTENNKDEIDFLNEEHLYPQKIKKHIFSGMYYSSHLRIYTFLGNISSRDKNQARTFIHESPTFLDYQPYIAFRLLYM